MTTRNWWTRVREWGQTRDADAKADAPPEELLLEPSAKEPPEEAKSEESEGTGPLARWMQRRQSAAQLEAGLEQLVQGNDRLAGALEKFTQAAEQNARKLDAINENQDRFVTMLDRHGKLLEQMVAEVQRLTAVADRFSAALEAVPKSTREQSEKLGAIEDQLQSGSQTDQALLQSMDTLGRHVAALVRHAESQPATHPDEGIRELIRHVQPLAELAAEQNRTARRTFVLAAIIALVVTGLAILSVFHMF
jgi:ABC-type transporter Mla subunit MlaD